MSDEVVIRVSNVSKDFVLPHEKVSSIKSAFTSLAKSKHRSLSETQHALKDINFEIKKGEFFGIVGRNGSGKSTLLKILAGIYQPNHGSVQTVGKLVPFIELGVGFNPELTGRENVYLNGAMLGFSQKEVAEMYDGIVEFAELKKFMDQKLKNYSSGMQVRLAFSMATRAKADILLVDEVLAVGDADFQRKCFEYFRNLKKNHKTVVFVTHDMSAVRQYCDRGILINDSKIMMQGSADDIAVEYARLFSEGGNQESLDVGETRWGNQKAILGKSTIMPKQSNNKKDSFSVTTAVTANEDIENLVIGFSIKNATGTGIVGTNTKLQKISTGKWHKSQTKVVQWQMPNVFADGNYSVSLAITEQDTITVCDWWEDALKFVSFEENPGPYVVSPEVICNISEA
ncbi:MAG: tagH [Candidatus Saccharibacteria bacterium]|nr:tagH [Candidatus Saccharibacteria bacterium]